MSENRDIGAVDSRSEFTDPEKRSWAARNMAWLIVIGILIIAAIGIYIWKEIEGNRYEKELTAQEQFYQGEIRRIVDEESRQYLQKIMMPFVWAVRTEMIRENMEQVSDYMRQFVNQGNVELVLIVNNEGKVIAATNQKLIGTNFEQNFSAGLTTTNEIAVQEMPDGQLAAAAPIVSYDSRLGTLVMVYQPNKYDVSYNR